MDRQRGGGGRRSQDAQDQNPGQGRGGGARQETLTTGPVVDAVNVEAEAPLQHYAVDGMVERWQQAGDVRVPGGNCWHCGSAIAYCVQIRHTATGERHEIGTTCAERVGLDVTQIKKQLAGKRAAQRAQRGAVERRNQPAAPSAPPAHGTMRRFFDGCQCLPCIDAVVRESPNTYRIGVRPVIIELATGHPVPATIIETSYGRRWRVGDGQTWLPVSPARRSTHANKGYVQASEVPCLVHRVRLPRGGHGEEVVCALASPLVDLWGTPVPHHRVGPAGGQQPTYGI